MSILGCVAVAFLLLLKGVLLFSPDETNLLYPGFCFPRVCQLFRANYNSEIRLEALWLISKALTEHDKSRLKSLHQDPEALFQSFVFRMATNREVTVTSMISAGFIYTLCTCYGF